MSLKCRIYLRVSLLLSQAVTVFTPDPALEETEMPKLVSVHKVSD